MAARSTSEWKIVTHVAVGPVRFGMSRDEVRTAIGLKPKPFMKTPEAARPADAFKLGGTKRKLAATDADGALRAPSTGADHVHVYYDADERCDLIEISCASGPGGPELDGRGFLNRPYERALAWARERDPAVEVEDSGFRSDALGIAVHAVEDKVESVSAFTAGYWSRPH